MADIKAPLTDSGRTATGELLQASVVDLIDLSLVAKQLHWHVQDPRFRSVHLQLDTVVEVARRFTDILAERSVTIGFPVDGRTATVAGTTAIDGPPTGFVRAEDACHEMSVALQGVGERLQRRIDTSADTDPVSQDQLIATAQAVQEQSWWFQSMDA